MLKSITNLACAFALGAATLVGTAGLGSNEAEAGYKHRHGYRYSYGYKPTYYGYGHRHYKPSHQYGCKVWSYGYHKKCLKWW